MLDRRGWRSLTITDRIPPVHRGEVLVAGEQIAAITPSKVL